MKEDLQTTEPGRPDAGSPVPDASIAVEEALHLLLAGRDPQAEGRPVHADVREHLEMLALLAYQAEEVAPSPTVKEALLERIAGRDGARVAEPVQARERSADVVRFPASPSVARFGWVVPALAASLALCLAGLGYFYGQLDGLRAQLAQRDEIVDRAQAEVADLHERLAMVDTVAQIAYPMRPASAEARPVSGPSPDGRVYVCGQHQRWYLTARHLEPAPAGREYHVWFLTDAGAIDAGAVEVRAGTAALRDLSMPEGTHGFALTLEESGTGGEGEAIDGPHGPTILLGDRPVAL